MYFKLIENTTNGTYINSDYQTWNVGNDNMISNDNIIENVSLIILNYITVADTIEYVQSVRIFYPSLRILIVDNNSPEDELEILQTFVNTQTNIKILYLSMNYGFSKGFNKGIDYLRQEGYSYIICSNNDVVFKTHGIIESLVNTQRKYGAAVVAPKVINLNNVNQNPYYIKRPGPMTARLILLNKSIPSIILKKFLPYSIKAMLFDKILTKNDYSSSNHNTSPDEPTQVYALNGSFLLFGPPFFANFNGFDEYTFLYGEELILAEMLYSLSLPQYYDPKVWILHKEDKTSNLVWGGQNRIKPSLYARRSIKYWYSKHYKYNDKKKKDRVIK